MFTSHVLNFLKYEIVKNSIRYQNFPTQREAYCFHLNRGKSSIDVKTFHSHKWPRQNFSLQYQYNIKQAGDENREECQPWDY